jgi:hypothetical protein
MYRPRYLKRKKSSDDNLLEITLKDFESVPVVHYKGKRIFKKGFVGIDYKWQTKQGYDLGKHMIEIYGYDLDGRNGYPVKDLIKKERGCQ